MTNLAHITETALLLLVAYLAGCALGYVVRRVLHAGRGTRRVAPPASLAAPPPELRKPRSAAARLAARVNDEPTPASGPPSPPLEAPRSAGVPVAAPSLPPPAKAIGTKPATLEQPRSGHPDNLKQIKGIGPKIEASLYAMGIFHIDQIAAWTRANIDWVDAHFAFKGRIRRERWVEQAQQLGTPDAAAPPRLSGRA